MSFDFSCVATPQETEIEIYDAKGKKAGLRVTLVPETSDQYQKAKRIAVEKYRAFKGKRPPASKEREINEKLFCARIGGWEWHGQLKDAATDFPFTQAKVRELLFADESFSVMVHNQIDEAIKDETNFIEEL